MKICGRVLRTFAKVSVPVLLLCTHSFSLGSERHEPVAAWRSSRADLQTRHDYYASAFSEEENQAIHLFLVATTPPEQVISSGGGRPIAISEHERHQIGEHLQNLLGSPLFPEEAVAYIGAYERQRRDRSVRRYQLSYLLGTMKVAIGGDLDDYSPVSVTVVLAQSDQFPHADLNISDAFSVDENPIMEIVEVENGVKKRLKTTLLRYEKSSPVAGPKGIVPF